MEKQTVEARWSLTRTQVDPPIKHPLFSHQTTCSHVRGLSYYQDLQKMVMSMAKQEHKYARVGKSMIMRNGMTATIIEYRSANDLDVKFADGTIVTSKTWQSFCNGKIANPSLKFVSPLIAERLNETRIMNNSMEATVIAYRSHSDIDVQFSDGAIAYNKTYTNFKKGDIPHPNNSPESKKQRRCGETRTMNNGLKATIIAYHGSDKIDVQFEDGQIVRSKRYSSFQKGSIAHPNLQCDGDLKNQRLGEERLMNCGLKAKIIGYRRCDDIDVQFEDGSIATNKRYAHFKDGTIAHPQISQTYMSLQEFAIGYYLNQCGFIKIQRGEWEDRGFEKLELDFYHDGANIAIEVDGGIHSKEGHLERDLRKNRLCDKLGLKLYRLRDSTLGDLQDGISINYILDGKQFRPGLVDCEDVLKEILNENQISFNDNLIDFSRDHQTIFEMHQKECINYYTKIRVGETVFHKITSQNMTIIAYRDYNHIDVQFDDGAIVYDKNYGAFKNGQIGHPSCARINTDDAIISRVGETITMKCGKRATIVAYRGYDDIDIEFEDGAIAEHKKYSLFQKGSIGYPKTT